jgi:hypothetical protein
MQEHKRSIFRSEAWSRYLARQEATVFPRLITPRNLAALWLLLALAIAAILMILSMEAPVYSSGTAIVVKGGVGGSDEIVLAVLLSRQQPYAFRLGNAASVELAKNQPPIIGYVIEVEKAQTSLQEAVTRFGLPADARSTIRFPASVVFVRLANNGGLFAPVNQNVIYQAQVQSGTQSAISYVISATTHE